ncbi:E3 ubiquitin-ligase RNF144A-like [Micractinium conductrix]|uniref:RBR-type E3 ubiquitin transferase n=1 Tax=Micractinium conductrix TaxID=554055 RepID=A0A2P6V4C0_9CHLO|nr:E3 ubiquitin-ligase RNF144A-like [Micractinium conductrix]|eukprot:PSC68928.1 E3 ubiquitin-ligase RNF144A-like [Micractinium conductrix]
MHSLGACKHAFCLPCLREYVAGKIQDRTFPIACPLPDCKQPIGAAECGLVLTPEEQGTLGQMETEAAVGEGARLYCPNPACSQLLLADDKRADVAMDCPYCQQELCANCGVAWHENLTCQQYQAQPGALRSKEDQALLDFAEKEGMRRCPACGVMVERIEGCSYMSCRCGSRFCYGCGKRKDPGSSHYCNCKPHHEQWLRPPPQVAAVLAQNAAAYQRQHQQQLQQRQCQQQQQAQQRQQRQQQQQAQQQQVQQQPQQQHRQRRRGARGVPAAQDGAAAAAAAAAAGGAAAPPAAPPPLFVPFEPGVVAVPPPPGFGALDAGLGALNGAMNAQLAALEDLARLMGARRPPRRRG